jgi:type IV pilus assembly protein PilC
MGAYAYKAVDTSGKTMVGTVEAADQASATKQLRSKGLVVVKLNEGTAGAGSRSFDTGSLPIIGGRIKSRDVALFSRQFATMVGAGLTILRCLMILETQVESDKLRAVLQEVAADIESGRALSDALEKHPKAFDRLYVSMVRAGEIGGVLEMTLQRVALQLEQREMLKRKIKSAMAYPVVVLIFALLATIGMILFLVPIFAKMYAELDSGLPAITQLLVNLSNHMRAQWYLVPIVLGTPVFAFKTWKGSKEGRRQWDRVRLKLPMKVGGIIQKLALARFSRILSSLIASGVPMMQAVQITGETSGNSVIEEAMDDIIAAIEQGRSFSEPLARHPIFPPMVVQMANIGEETGKMDAMLEKVAEYYEDEVDAAVKALTSIIEPILMVFVGMIVGFIVLALYMPMFSLFDKIK